MLNGIDVVYRNTRSRGLLPLVHFRIVSIRKSTQMHYPIVIDTITRSDLNVIIFKNIFITSLTLILWDGSMWNRALL